MMRTLLALTMFRSRLLVCGLVAACFGSVAASPAHAAWTWEKGGLLDGSTGLVWSQSQVAETGSLWTWNGAKTRAANYVVSERDTAGNVVATYDDWRVPTVKELQTAIANGTMKLAKPSAGGLWSSEARGNKAWWVSLEFNNLGEVDGGGVAKQSLKDSGFEVLFVRTAAP